MNIHVLVNSCLEILDQILIGKEPQDPLGSERVALYQLPTNLKRIQTLLRDVRTELEKKHG